MNQVITKYYSDSYEMAKAYYSFILALNHIHVAPMELSVLAFTGVKGTISTGGAVRQYIELFGSTPATIANVKIELFKKQLLVLENRKYVVNKQIAPGFQEELNINLNLKWKNQ